VFDADLRLGIEGDADRVGGKLWPGDEDGGFTGGEGFFCSAGFSSGSFRFACAKRRRRSS
jgi:hypothetical protein